MKIKLSDTDKTEVVVSTVSKNYCSNGVTKDNNGVSINILINKPNKDFDYYKGLFIDDSVSSFEVLDSNGVAIDTLGGSKVENVSYTYQDDNLPFVNIQIV
nr:MAG TPA: hypothetical protein [Caudoviricetes sp.]